MVSPALPKKAAGRDAEATRNRILDAAEEEFARAGLLGARTEAIAANTGVTKAMIYYYFSDKEGLYRAVLERALSRRLQILERVDLQAADPVQTLQKLVESFIDGAGQNQNLPAIFLFESVQNQGRFYGQLAIASLYSPLVQVLEHGMASGHFRQLDPLHVAVNIVGSAVYYFCSAQNVKHLWPAGTDVFSTMMREQHKREAVDMIVAGVLKPG